MRVTRALAALCAGVCWVGCGGGDEPAAPAAAASPAGEQAQANPNNRPPVIEAVTLSPSRPRPGQSVRAQVVARDEEDDTLSYRYEWRVAGSPAGTDAAELHVEAVPRESSIEVTVVARDSDGGESDPATGYARVGNLPPTIVNVLMMPEGLVTAGNDVTATPKATDPEGDEIQYRYRWTLNGETLPNEGPKLPAKLLKRGDKVVLEVWASDGYEETEPLQSAPIEVVNASPRVTSTPGPIGADGVFRYTMRADDPDGDKSFRYRLVKGPQGMSVGFDDGLVEWTPGADATGNHEVEIAVEDLFGAATAQKFTLQIAFVTEPAPAAQAPAE
jgi:hypothetical protein